MKIKLSQLRRIIREEVSKTIVEADASADVKAKVEDVLDQYRSEIEAAIKAAMEKAKKDPNLAKQLQAIQSAEGNPKIEKAVGQAILATEGKLREIELPKEANLAAAGFLGAPLVLAMLPDFVQKSVLDVLPPAQLGGTAMMAIGGAILGFIADAIIQNTTDAYDEKKPSSYWQQ